MDNHLSRKFEEIVGKDNVLASEADRHSYSYDAAVLPPRLPALAVRPETPEALGRVVATCNELGLPLTVRGSGTNLSGGTIPSRGGVVALTGALDKIIEINEADMLKSARLLQKPVTGGTPFLRHLPMVGGGRVSPVAGSGRHDAGIGMGLAVGIEVVPDGQVHVGPVIEAGAFEVAILKGKAEGLNQMQRGPGRRAQSGDTAGILRNFRLVKDDLDHATDSLV